MDKIKDAVSGSGSNSNSGNNGKGKDYDYVDKGLDTAEQKYGGMSEEDTQKHRETNEKITDTARNQFESATGKDVPDKISR